MEQLTIQSVASWLTGTAVIVAAVFKFVDWIRKPGQQESKLDGLSAKHDADMKALREEDAKRHSETQAELQILCYGLRGALQGLIETGCNGPCKEALKRLDKHLNKSAHE